MLECRDHGHGTFVFAHLTESQILFVAHRYYLHQMQHNLVMQEGYKQNLLALSDQGTDPGPPPPSSRVGQVRKVFARMHDMPRNVLRRRGATLFGQGPMKWCIYMWTKPTRRNVPDHPARENDWNNNFTTTNCSLTHPDQHGLSHACSASSLLNEYPRVPTALRTARQTWSRIEQRGG